MLTVVCIPDLYPDPLLPILIAETIPVLPIIAVPPAATSDWYPNPSLDPTDTIIPPKGKLDPFGSEVNDVAVPVNETEEIPEFSKIVYSLVLPFPWKISLTKRIVSVCIPVTFCPSDLRVNVLSIPLNWFDILSNT